MDYTRMRLESDGYIAQLTLTSPETMNAVDETFHLEMIDAFEQIRADRKLRAVVLANEGRVFSAGGDFDFMLLCNESLDVRLRMVDDAYRLIDAQLNVEIPIVVAMNGHAIGVGGSIALCCDMIVAHRKCRIGDPHVVCGLVAGDGGCLVYPASAGLMRAKRQLLTGEPLNAEDAYQFGLITDLVDEPGEVLPTAMRIAEQIAALPPLAVRLTKKTLNRGFRARFNEVQELAFTHELATLGSDDLREAVAAYREKRAGRYVGH